ncbi:hypothetical protein EX30DRAFT_391656 [Ascodesmis nigricans]|uniref:Uncharacterized protein n=1 Tax=Ascodesmis nigricans TaxID=341454 RepID=A0A4V3SIS4_9PEZI|nr:hypothetical protein EX30DRAFT_391656 [Ascodesmis nigricans]
MPGTSHRTSSLPAMAKFRNPHIEVATGSVVKNTLLGGSGDYPGILSGSVPAQELDRLEWSDSYRGLLPDVIFSNVKKFYTCMGINLKECIPPNTQGMSPFAGNLWEMYVLINRGIVNVLSPSAVVTKAAIDIRREITMGFNTYRVSKADSTQAVRMTIAESKPAKSGCRTFFIRRNSTFLIFGRPPRARYPGSKDH